ncbi:hypothetical protein C8R48DRAFT_781664 [Suillus tomentosus]|nr:hypothetical protein C8R48DRAFT_781664 [Suillus tomentosus]
MATCLSLELFDYSSACARLIASQKLHTELHVLSFLLKDRVYPGDLWDLIGERSVEAKQEERLRRHQSLCTSGDSGRHATVERFLMEERKKRCQMEVSLYSQAIELLEQHWMSRVGFRTKHIIRPPSASSRQMVPTDYAPLPCAPLACSIATREKCRAWLTMNTTYLIPATDAAIRSVLQEERWNSISSNVSDVTVWLPGLTASLQCVSPSLPLSSTWITTDVREAFHRAFQEELTLQAELMVASLATRRNNAYLRNLGLDLLILQAKMRRAQAEIELYSLAIENIHRFDLSGSSSTTSFHSTGSRCLCEAAPLYDEDVDDSTGEGYEDCMELVVDSTCLSTIGKNLKKVVRAVMSPLTNFCVQGEIQERVTYFVLLLESDDSYQVQRAIQELTV